MGTTLTAHDFPLKRNAKKTMQIVNKTSSRWIRYFCLGTCTCPPTLVVVVVVVCCYALDLEAV